MSSAHRTWHTKSVTNKFEKIINHSGSDLAGVRVKQIKEQVY